MLPLIPIITSILPMIGKLFGGSTGSKIEQGVGLLEEGLNAISNTKLTPEQKAEMQKIDADLEVKLAEVGFKREKLDYDDAAGGRSIIQTALLSDDPVVRRARPKMMIKLGNFCLFYAIFAPLSVIGATSIGLDATELPEYITILKWIGGFLFSSFMTSFTGYTVARSVDKKTFLNGGTSGGIWNLLSKVGNKIK